MKKLTSLLMLSVLPLAAAAFETPTMGWSSWNTYRCNISDSLIVAQAKALKELGLADAGYVYVNIDDGFQGGRDSATGRLLINPVRFPGGLAPVVDSIHSLGLKAGIYSDAGRNTCGNYHDRDTLAVNVGLYGHEDLDCGMYFNDLGFDFIKVDFCGGDPEQNNQRFGLDPETAYRRIAAAMAATGRDDLRMNVCRWNYPGTWVSDVATSWRISHDIWCEWSCVRDIIAENLYLSAYARDGRYNDMDMLEVGRTLSDREDETHFAMWCMMSSPLLIGCDVTTLRPATLRLLLNPELIAIDQDPLGNQARVIQRDANGGYILAKNLENERGTKRAVAFYNPTDSAIVLRATLADLELTGPAPCRNAIEQAYLGTVESDMRIYLEPHETEVYTLTGRSRLPRTVYEAEDAYLSSYQEIYNPEAVGTAAYVDVDGFSGGVGVKGAGVTPLNDIVWDDVYVDAPGQYTVTIDYLTDAADASHFYLAANGGDGTRIKFTPADGMQHASAVVTLAPGRNTLRLYATSRIPLIDRITITQ